MTFEEKIYSMFDSIWDCEIDHPVFQDTVGELMEAAIAVYNDIHGNFVYVGDVLDLINDTNVSGGFANYNAYSTLFNGVDNLNTYALGITHCKDCKHCIREDIEEQTPYGFYNTCFHTFCDKHWDKEQKEYIDVNLDDFCSKAERRTE